MAGATAAVGMFAAVAQAHDVQFTYNAGTTVGSCGSVTYSYYNFNAGSNTVQETLALGSSPPVTKNFTFTASGVVTPAPYTFNASDTVPITGGFNGESATASASWFPAEAQGSSSTDPGAIDTPLTFTLSCVAGPPTVTITTPANGATYYQGENVPSNYTCTAGVFATLKSCIGPVPDGSPVNTSTVGNNQCFTVIATDTDGQTAQQTNCYNVVALTYTGRAYDVFARAGLLGLIKETVGPVNDTGSFSQTTSASGSNTVVPITGTPLTANVLNVAYAFGAGSSSFTAQVGNETLSLTGVPTVVSNQITANSKTTCTAGTRHSTGSTSIAFLQIGTTVVVGPAGSGALIPSGPIPANTVLLNVPGVAKVVLNEQTPITDGLSVNAIDVTVGVAPLVSAQVIVSHAESDLHGCAAVTG
jgi:hypothetical protein